MKMVYFASLVCLMGSALQASAELDQPFGQAQSVLRQGPAEATADGVPVRKIACNPNIEDCPPPSACNPNIEDCGRPVPPPSCNPNIEDCGTRPPFPPIPMQPACTARGYFGRTVDEAIRNCAADRNNPWNSKSCAEQGVACNRGAYPVRMCVSGAVPPSFGNPAGSVGIPGTSVFDAVNNCDRLTNMSRKDCALNVRCQGFGVICFSNGVAGDDIHSAIDNCDKHTPMSRSNCAAIAFCAQVQPWQ